MEEISLNSQAHKPVSMAPVVRKTFLILLHCIFDWSHVSFKLCLHANRSKVFLITSAEFKLLIFLLFLNPMFIGWSEWQVSHALFFYFISCLVLLLYMYGLYVQSNFRKLENILSLISYLFSFYIFFLKTDC